jgi:proteasome lid subunit RPN8/RPN11
VRIEEKKTLMAPGHALLWVRLVREVRARGLGHRESGAFLLGRRKDGRAKAITYALYDDLDSNALQQGIIVFHAAGFKALWKRCRDLQMDVVADLHTHGDGHPRQSTLDQENPMITKPGHLAMILPFFAGTWGWRFRNVAVCEYVGDYKWRTWTGKRRKKRVRFCWW